MRQALGASRGRLVRQLLAESLLLAFVGAGLGALLAQALSRFLVSFISTAGDTVFLALGMDWRVLGFTAGLAVLTCVLFGLAPALRATSVEPGKAMNATGRGLTASRERFTLRRALVVLQVALSLVLVAGALLFTRSLNKLLTVDTGFQQEGILIAGAGFTRLNIPPERRLGFRDEMLARIKAIPGVEAAVDTATIPLSGGGRGNNIWLDGSTAERKINTSINQVGRGFFKTLGTPLLAGRDFDERDANNSAPVAIVNENFARQLLNGANPVGRRLRIEATPNDPETAYEIVGLVRDTKYAELTEAPEPIVYLASSQNAHPGTSAQFLIRSSLAQGAVTEAVRRVLVDMNPGINLSFLGFQSMIQESLLRERLLATLSGFFGGLALLLASIGLYGILSYGVASRTKEIGIRMALGAQSRAVLSLVLREALVLVLVGLAVGLPLVFAVKRFVSTLLFGLAPTDPVSLGLAALLMFVVAMIAGYLPARRATKVDPLVALRYE